MEPRLDTTNQAREAQLAAFRAMGPKRRVAAAFEMSEEARQIAAAGIRARHPGNSPAEVERRLVRLMLGADLASLIERVPEPR